MANIVISELVAEQVQEMWRHYQDHKDADQQPTPQQPAIPAPRTIIVKVHASGIAARSGTTVSSASCDIFEIVGSTLTDTTFNVDVYNLSTTAVTASIYVPASQNRFGEWVVGRGVWS
jgi:hypothetical protein